jgi:L-malate glycosyltransferase
MNVLFVLYTPRYSGAEIMIRNLIENNSKIDSFVLCSPGFFSNGLTNCKKIFYTHGIMKLKRYSKFSLRSFLKLVVIFPVLNTKVLYIIIRYRIKTIHVNNINLATYLLPLCFFFKVLNINRKFIWHDHNLSIGKNYEKYLYKLCFHFYNNTIVVSKAVLNKYELNDKLKLIYGGVDCEKFKFDSSQRNIIRKELKVDNKIVIGFFGIFNRGKGTEFLIDNLMKIYNYRKKIFLLMIGRFEENLNFEKKILYKLQNNFGDNFKIIDWTDEIETYYSAVDILVNSTLKILREPLGATILEAMSSERLILAPGSDGPLEIIEGGKNGYLFDPNDKNNFLFIINYLIDNNKDLSIVGKQARERVLEYFNIEKMVAEFNNILGL